MVYTSIDLTCLCLNTVAHHNIQGMGGVALQTIKPVEAITCIAIKIDVVAMCLNPTRHALQQTSASV